MQNRYWIIAALFAFAAGSLGCGGQDDGGVPDSISGFFTVGHQHNADDGDVFMAIGMVVTPRIDVEGALEQHFNYFTDIEQDSCAQLETVEIGDASTQFYNAGNVSVSGPNGSLPLSPFIGLYVGSGADSLFEPGAEYTISGDGSGDLGAFDGAVLAPERLTVSTPDPTGTITVDRASDLAIEWTTSSDAENVYVSIEQEGTTTQSWMCKFADTGSASIPTSVLSGLEEDTSGFDTEIVVYAYQQSTFDGPGILGPFGTLFVSETRMDAIVQ